MLLLQNNCRSLPPSYQCTPMAVCKGASCAHQEGSVALEGLMFWLRDYRRGCHYDTTSESHTPNPFSLGSTREPEIGVPWRICVVGRIAVFASESLSEYPVWFFEEGHTFARSYLNLFVKPAFMDARIETVTHVKYLEVRLVVSFSSLQHGCSFADRIRPVSISV